MSEITKTKVQKPRAKRITMADIRKENEALKATNLKLLGDIGKLSAVYMNEIAKNNQNAGSREKEAAVIVGKGIVAFLMQKYRLSVKDLFN